MEFDAADQDAIDAGADPDEVLTSRLERAERAAAAARDDLRDVMPDRDVLEAFGVDLRSR